MKHCGALLVLLLCVSAAQGEREAFTMLEQRVKTLEHKVASMILNMDDDRRQDMATRLNASENNVKELKKENRALQNDTSALKTQNSALLAQLSTLEMRLNTTESEMEEVKRHNAAVHPRNEAQHQSEMEEVKRHNAVLLVDCEEIYNNVSTQCGVYNIYPTAASRPAKVYCDMDTDGGKWTVIQRRMDGTVDFYRPWAQYKAGFGDASGEYWLGLDNMHLLTKNKTYQLRVDMEDFEGNTTFASYSSFSVGSEDDGYKLQVAGFQEKEEAGDSLASHNGMKFSTFDKDQDEYSAGNCANDSSGAFWYWACEFANPNGLYLRGQTDQYGKGVHWFYWKGWDYSLKAVAMKIRRVP